MDAGLSQIHYFHSTGLLMLERPADTYAPIDARDDQRCMRYVRVQSRLFRVRLCLYLLLTGRLYSLTSPQIHTPSLAKHSRVLAKILAQHSAGSRSRDPIELDGHTPEQFADFLWAVFERYVSSPHLFNSSFFILRLNVILSTILYHITISQPAFKP
jgi:hypothetical protein